MTVDRRRITAPALCTSTVLVASANGSRLSLPSTARTPLTVTGTSRATVCGLPLFAGRFVEVSDGKRSVSFNVDAMSYSLAEGVSLSPARRRTIPEPIHCSALPRP